MSRGHAVPHLLCCWFCLLKRSILLFPQNVCSFLMMLVGLEVNIMRQLIILWVKRNQNTVSYINAHIYYALQQKPQLAFYIHSPIQMFILCVLCRPAILFDCHFLNHTFCLEVLRIKSSSVCIQFLGLLLQIKCLIPYILETSKQ